LISTFVWRRAETCAENCLILNLVSDRKPEGRRRQWENHLTTKSEEVIPGFSLITPLNIGIWMAAV
jgi:hypothetical protein